MSATPFSRTMRSLDADSFGPSLVALIFAMLILLFWSSWFFFAQIPLTDISQNVQVSDDQLFVAQFAPETLQHLVEGQSAYLHLNGFQKKVIPAMIMEIDLQNKEITLVPDDEFLFSDDLLQQVKAVEVEIESISPATLIMRAAFSSP